VEVALEEQLVLLAHQALQAQLIQEGVVAAPAIARMDLVVQVVLVS
jgi:hypothetical protein